MTKEEFLAIAAQEYDKWKSGKSSSFDVGFYEFEKGFEGFMNNVGKKAMEASLGKAGDNRRKKKKS